MPCLYWSTSKKLIVVIYVDDCRVMGTKASITALIDFLASHYPITANPDSEYLSLELRQLPNSVLKVSMQRYASDMLAELGFANARSATAPRPPRDRPAPSWTKTQMLFRSRTHASTVKQ